MSRIVSLAFCLPLIAAQPVSLPVSEDTWTPQPQNAGSVTGSDAVRMAMVACPRGKCLSVGPWRSGRSGARFAHSKRIDGAAGVLHGWYRTSGLYPRQASVNLQFYNGEERVGNRTLSLDAAPQGAQFAAPVVNAPPRATSMILSLGLSEQTEGSVLFGGLSYAPAPYEPRFPDVPLPLTRPAPPARYAPGKYFRIERNNGAWWLVTPEGKPFFSVGIDPPAFRDEAKGREYVSAFRRLGFNSLAGWHDLRRWAALNDALIAEGAAPVAQFRSLQTNTANPAFDLVVDARGALPGTPSAQQIQRGGFNHAFPDPFDPRWERVLREQVRTTAAAVKGKPYFVAWFADNEREHRELHRYVWSPNAAVAFRAMLERRHKTIGALNKAWRTDFASFDDLAARKVDPAVRGNAMYEDFHAFRRELLRRYNKILLRVIREEDPGRLVFTNRFMIAEGRDLLDNLDLYSGYDAVAVNVYPDNLHPGLEDHQRALLRLIHEKTGKPLLIGEWSVPARDSGLYNNADRLDWSYPQTLATQRDRANQAARVQAEFYNFPFLVGAHYFIWSDFDSPVRQANRGLFKASGEPWPEIQDALRRVNARIAAVLEGRPR